MKSFELVVEYWIEDDTELLLRRQRRGSSRELFRRGAQPPRRRIFRAEFEPIAGRVIVCDSGALATPDYRRLQYRNVRRPIFPLDPELDDPAISLPD